MGNNYGKWIGGALGWAFGGPLGALFGFAVGSMFDTTESRPGTQEHKDYKQYRHHTTHDDFVMSLLALSAAVMKADGVKKKAELDYIRDFFTKQFGRNRSNEAISMLKGLLDREIPLRKVAEQIRYNMEHPLRLQLLHYMFNIARADGHIHQSEVDVIRRIAQYLGISERDYKSIEATFYSDLNHAYTVLEINKTASDSEVKKAYRKMAVKYHPDKVSHLGEEFKQAANEKFLKVKEAYEQIKKERGMT